MPDRDQTGRSSLPVVKVSEAQECGDLSLARNFGESRERLAKRVQRHASRVESAK